MKTVFVHETWNGGRKHFNVDLRDGEAKAVLTPIHKCVIDASAYRAETFPPRKVFYVDFIKVSPPHRGCGYGAAVRDAIVRWSDMSRNVVILDAIPIDTGMDKHRLVRFYASVGFKHAEEYNETAMYYLPK